MAACKPAPLPVTGAAKAAMTAGVAVKVHTTAVAVVPPAAVWRHIQAIRCFRDKSFVRWPPHINLLYPFFPDDHDSNGRRATVKNATDGGGDGRGGADNMFQTLALRASRALRNVAPFRVRLERLRTFRHSTRSLTVWAEPSLVSETAAVWERATTAGAGDAAAGADALGRSSGHGRASAVGSGGAGVIGGSGVGGCGGLLEMQRLLEAEFPECGDLSRDEGRGIDGFVPHLSLGQLRHEDEVQALQAAWQPLEFLVDGVQLISRQGYLSPFTIRYHVPLGLDLDPRLGREDLDLDLDPGIRRAGASRDSVGRCVVRLDVPYVATMASQAGDGGEAFRLVRRFAPPCLVLPSPPPGLVLPQPSSQPPCRAPGDEPSGGCGPRPAGDASQRTGLESAARSPAVGASTPAACHGAGAAAGAAAGTAATEGAAAPPTATASSSIGAGVATGPGLDRMPQGEQRDEAEGRMGAEGREARGESPNDGGGADGSAGGYVWWFAYGGALAAHSQRVGAVQSVTARLEGYRLAFNRRGGRANLVPNDEPAGPSAAARRRLDSPVATHGSIPQGPSTAGCPQAAAAASAGSHANCSLSGAEPEGAAERSALPVIASRVQDGDGDSGGGDGERPSGGAAAPAAVHGVLHKLPVNCAARLLLAVGDACPVDVRCVPYGRVVDHRRDDGEEGADAGAAVAASSGGGNGGGDDDGGGETGTPGAAVAAVAFMAPPERCLVAAAVPPTEGYMTALRQAYELYDIDAGFKEWLRRIASVPDAAGREPQYHTGVGGRPLAGAGTGSGARRTGAKKAAGGLPRSVVDW